MAWILILLAIAVGWALARGLRVTSLRGAAHEKLRPGGQQATGIAGDVSRLTRDHTSATELGTYGSVTAAEFVWSWATIDPSVVKAAALSSGDSSIDSGLDFANWINSSFHSASPIAQEGFLTRLQGYVGEQQVADLLVAQGHTVELASTANQPVWDLLIDGHAANVKTVADIGSVKADALAHHDVTYIVPQDALGHIGDNVATVAGFNHEAIKQSLKESVASAKGETAAHAMGMHLPWITIGFAAYRNYKAVQLGQDLQVAIQHAVIESVGRGAGVLIGGKIGAGLGMAFGPGGALVGGVLLGIGGALFGGAIAEEYKLKELRVAVARLEQSLHGFGQGFSGKLDSIRGYVQTPVYRAKKTLTEINQEIQQRTSRWQWWLWPDFYTVLLQEASKLGVTKIAEQEASAQVVSNIISDARTSGKYEKVGLLMANSPTVCELVGFNKAELDRIHAARVEVFKERKKLNPQFAAPA